MAEEKKKLKSRNFDLQRIVSNAGTLTNDELRGVLLALGCVIEGNKVLQQALKTAFAECCEKVHKKKDAATGETIEETLVEALTTKHGLAFAKGIGILSEVGCDK